MITAIYLESLVLLKMNMVTNVPVAMLYQPSTSPEPSAADVQAYII